MCVSICTDAHLYSPENLLVSAPPQNFSLEAPYRYHFQYVCQVIKPSPPPPPPLPPPPPPSWPSCWLSLVHHGCLWSSRGWVHVESLQGCLCSSSKLSSIIHRAVWQLAAPPGLCLPLPISDWLCMHNQSSSMRIWDGNCTILHLRSNTEKWPKGIIMWYRKCSCLAGLIRIGKLSSEIKAIHVWNNESCFCVSCGPQDSEDCSLEYMTPCNHMAKGLVFTERKCAHYSKI